MRARRTATLVAAMAVVANASPVAAALPRGRYPGVTSRLPRADGAIAVTFDDGPHPRGTIEVLSSLRDLGIEATFFVLGEQAARHPRVVSEIAAAGHEVALHGYRHLPHALMTPAAVTRDLARGQATIEDIAGCAVRALRAPFGAASVATLIYANRNGLQVTGWSRWGWDWSRRATPESIARSVSSGVCGGDILLLHDSDSYSAPGSWRRTVAALPAVAAAVAGAGLSVTRISVPS
jgi:peptidoglycan-N-acetylglucosamine deacetylase